MHYHHIQVGWLTNISLVATLVAITWVFMDLGMTWVAGISAAIMLLILVLFATLKLTIDERSLRFAFGIGIIKKTIPLHNIRHFEPVHNKWYWGWGVRLYPGGMLYNVSGLSAVELTLNEGKKLRIGTDEPEAVCAVLARILGQSQPLTSEEDEAAVSKARKRHRILIAAILLLFAAIPVLFFLEEQPPRTEIGPHSVTISSFMYSAEVSFGDITKLSLEDELPPIKARTNGYAFGQTLRGHFRLADGTKARLFVEHGRPPYVVVKSKSGYLAVNFEDADKTRGFFSDLTNTDHQSSFTGSSSSASTGSTPDQRSASATSSVVR